MGRRLFPREGLTMEALVAPIRLTALQPLLTGALLLGLYRYPKLVAKWLPGKIQPDYLFKVLVVTFGLGLVRKASNTLSKLMLNNFTADKTWDWKKEVVVVTGGCGGLGSTIARMFAEKGVKVVVLDVSNAEFSQKIPNITYYQVDITSTKSIREVAQQIRTDIGDPTVLINNAGIGTNKTILDESEAELRRVFDVNTISHFLLVKEFAPSMIRSNHGHIVTVASMASFLVHTQNVDYAASKASALAFHEGLSQEFKSRYNASKIRTTVVHPTWVRTPMITTLTEKAGFSAFVLEPATVAEIVVDQVMSGYGAQLILPGRLNLVTLVRGLPSWVGESMRNNVAHDLDL